MRADYPQYLRLGAGTVLVSRFIPPCIAVANRFQERGFSQILDGFKPSSISARLAHADHTLSFFRLGTENAISYTTAPVVQPDCIFQAGGFAAHPPGCSPRVACSHGPYELPCADHQQDLIGIPGMVLVSRIAAPGSLCWAQICRRTRSHLYPCCAEHGAVRAHPGCSVWLVSATSIDII